MLDNFEKLEKRIDDYFDNVTDEQLAKDLEKAGYEFYKNIKVKVFSMEETDEDNNRGSKQMQKKFDLVELVADMYRLKRTVLGLQAKYGHRDKVNEDTITVLNEAIKKANQELKELIA